MQTPQDIIETLQYKLSDSDWEDCKADIKEELDSFKKKFIDAGFYDEVKDQIEEMEQKFK